MKPYEARAWISFFFGITLIAMGTYVVTGTNTPQTVNFGFVLITIGSIFVSITVAIKLSAQTTEEMTKNIIDIMILEGLISSDSKLHLNKDLQVVKPVSSTITIKYNVEKDSEVSRRKSDIHVTPDGITIYPDGTEVDRKGTIIKMGSNYKL